LKMAGSDISSLEKLGLIIAHFVEGGFAIFE
jgi:hypothetical protein